MALFKDSDFNDLLIDINDKNLDKNELIIQMYGKLGKSDLPIIRYISLMYDQRSPLRQKIANIVNRKEEASSIAGLDDTTDIFDLSNDKLIRYINIYLRRQSSKIWAILSANEEVLWQYQQELLKPITDFKNDKDKLQALEIKSKLMSECDAIIKRIEAYEEKIFGDLKEKKDEIINYTPESIANI